MCKTHLLTWFQRLHSEGFDPPTLGRMVDADEGAAEALGERFEEVEHRDRVGV